MLLSIEIPKNNIFFFVRTTIAHISFHIKALQQHHWRGIPVYLILLTDFLSIAVIVLSRNSNMLSDIPAENLELFSVKPPYFFSLIPTTIPILTHDGFYNVSQGVLPSFAPRPKTRQHSERGTKLLKWATYPYG